MAENSVEAIEERLAALELKRSSGEYDGQAKKSARKHLNAKIRKLKERLNELTSAEDDVENADANLNDDADGGLSDKELSRVIDDALDATVNGAGPAAAAAGEDDDEPEDPEPTADDADDEGAAGNLAASTAPEVEGWFAGLGLDDMDEADFAEMRAKFMAHLAAHKKANET
eukprot:CAMPEP_0118870316 /NCGR_PEP_ID=MMETSP1163-20130328/13336_1 /TAXON_ID=124430 /ORGANISM="Phaeomonas parva, Strain CCMP2877" /LENGTH=171 /DNA_ID=CAMNT_0006805309 /DNA_START=20 /DNA_END=531 /DNA_ORIENTATION=+